MRSNVSFPYSIFITSPLALEITAKDNVGKTVSDVVWISVNTTPAYVFSKIVGYIPILVTIIGF